MLVSQVKREIKDKISLRYLDKFGKMVAKFTSVGRWRLWGGAKGRSRGQVMDEGGFANWQR